MRICEICGKKPINGNSIVTRGLPKRTGGIGIKTTGIKKRVFRPNLQKVRVRFPSGTLKTIKVCTSCIQAGKIVKVV
ncbi:MAG TPA: 50S ribosomal protein L28 [Candidatus Omnitrophota bacterium]|nr:50S ribosomal protein L28 [Candidatus Omnitrophota bacterium]